MSSPLSQVKNAIAKACQESNRTPDGVKLIAVSKTWPADDILAVLEDDHLVFGENKLQELETKCPELPTTIEWHFIGHLQRNKIRKVLQYTNWIHSVSSIKLLEAINRIAHEEQKCPNIFLQVNIDAEESKSGFLKEDLSKAVKIAHELENISLAGLMCIPMPRDNEDEIRATYRSFCEFSKTLEADTSIPLPSLSMGMSNDFEIAIEEGATHVRVGSAIFGRRNYSQ